MDFCEFCAFCVDRRAVARGFSRPMPEPVSTATYVKVIDLEAAIIVLLYVFGRLFS